MKISAKVSLATTTKTLATFFVQNEITKLSLLNNNTNAKRGTQSMLSPSVEV